MQFLKEKSECPQTDKTVENQGKYRLVKWLFPFTGIFALIWFLIRVIPKPSRALYPCQRVAFPLASGFIIWLTGIVVSIAAFRRARVALAKARYVTAAIAIIASVGMIWFSMSATFEKSVKAVVRPPQTANDPVGEAKGVHPGRVAWVWDANATNWVYTSASQTDYCWLPNHTDQARVSAMLSRALRELAGTNTDAEAWDAIFRNFNQRMGKGDVGYQPGEKIGIKINNTLSCSGNTTTMDKGGSWKANIDDSPQLAIALLRQLIDMAGVAPGDISIGDPGKIIPNYWYNMVEANCPGVVYVSVVGGQGRTASAWSNVPFYWSDPCSAHFPSGMEQDYIPTCFSNAAYFINFPVLKTHATGGVTINGKNHYGSLRRNPDGTMSYSLGGTTPAKRYNMHTTLPQNTPGMGHYRCLVDLMGHAQLGGKTLISLVDALFAGEGWDGVPSKWTIAPFNNDWPSSIFVSQDQVAADSVGFDFLLAQWPKETGANMSGSDDYLHEAAEANNPPSGAFYDPSHSGTRLASLGVHEHWNNATDKQYSRNLDPENGTGIELTTELPILGDFNSDGSVDLIDFAVLANAWRTHKGDAKWNAACDISIPSDNTIDLKDLEVFAENWLAGK